MMKSSKSAVRTSMAIALVAAAISTTAQAEYRCATPGLLTVGEKRACELARQDTPDALVSFVNRTKGVYGLITNDYVSTVDVQRWELAKQHDIVKVAVKTD